MAVVESRYAHPQAPSAAIACIELDRFCEGCAYNLRTLPVCRDQRTGIPVVRCPECGRFQPANDAATALRPWLQRMTAVLLITWMLMIVAAFISVGLAEGSINYATLDELTEPEGSKIERINNMTIRRWVGSGPLEVMEDYPYYGRFITLIVGSSFLIALVGGIFAVVVFAHWPRVAYVALVLAMPALATGMVALVWSHEAPHLFMWGLQYIAAHLGAQLLGGMAGITFGRPLARLGVRIILPPSVRPRLAFLWLADNKPLPHSLLKNDVASPLVGDGNPPSASPIRHPQGVALHSGE